MAARRLSLLATRVKGTQAVVPRYVDRGGYTHFNPRGPFSGGSVSRKTGIVVGALCAISGVFYYTHLEYVPYTNRKHLVLISPQSEMKLGEFSFNELKQQYKNRILPPHHPAVVKVSKIARDVIQAAVEGVKMGGEVELHYSHGIPQHVPVARLDRSSDDEFRFPEPMKDRDLFREHEMIVDDVWVEETRKDGMQKGRRASTKHVDHFKWEIVVVESPQVNAACLPGGKIVVFTGILKAFHNEAQIATVIGHEVGHAIARHVAETLTRTIFIGFFELLMLAIIQVPNVVGTASNLLLRLPFSRKMEMEADHVGVLIMAAAGYDPRLSPSVYLKLGELQKLPEFAQYISTHPSGKTRAQALVKSKAMQEAITIYESRRTGWANSGFLL